MAFTKKTLILAAAMLVFGSINTISTNYANMIKTFGTESPSTVWGKLNKENEAKHLFDHPFFQAACMFVGEFLCMIAYLATKKKRSTDSEGTDAAGSGGGCLRSQVRKGSFWWAIPACCDMCCTGIMYAGLCLSYASVFQMLRGSVVVFTAGISAIFLHRKIYSFQWFAVFLVVVGVTIVGITSLTGSSDTSKDHTGVMIGNFLIISAQVIAAIMMCVEEKIMSVYPTPALKVVGLEGTFGFCILASLLVPMYYINIDGKPFENVPDALSQMGHNPYIIVAMGGNVLSIAFFNFCGISITKYMSASHRMVLDSFRTLVVWGYSLAVGWETFHWLQLLGFVILSLGTAIYNEIIMIPRVFNYPTAEETADCSRSFVGDGDHGSFLGKVEASPDQRLLDQQGRGAAAQWESEF